MWALQTVKPAVYRPVNPSVILTDQDRELEKSVFTEYPFVTHLLCILHVKNNVLEHVQKVWGVNSLDDEEREVNMKL